jgi:nitrogen regulatory protein PII
MANAINDSGIKKLKLLYTVVDRPKAEFYLDVLSQFEVNFQVAAGGKGTAKSEIIDMLGLNINKVVIMSVVREDKVNEIMNCLEQKFSTIKNGKGIAFAVPFSSVIGVNMYQFLSNNKHSREDKKNENQ